LKGKGIPEEGCSYPEPFLSRKGKLFFALFFLLMAGGVRFYHLGEKPLWYDEFVGFSGAWLDGKPGEKLAVATGDLFGLIFFEILDKLSLPLSPFTFRILPALLGTVLVPAVFLLAPHPERFPLALFFLLSPFALYYSQEARPYSGVLFFSAILWLILYRREREQLSLTTKRLRFLGMVSALMGGLFSPFFFLGAGIPFAFFLISSFPRGRWLAVFSLFALLYGSYLLLWLPHYDFAWFDEIGFKLHPVTSEHIRELSSWLIGSGFSETLQLFGILLLVLGIIVSFVSLPRLVFSFLGSFLLFALFFPLTHHYFGFRYLIGILPAVILLLYRGISAVGSFFLWLFSLPKRLGFSLSFLLATSYLLGGFMPFYLAWEKLPLKPTMITSTHAGIAMGKLPLPGERVVIFSGIEYRGGKGLPLPEPYLFLNLIEVYGVILTHPEFRGKKMIFLGGSRFSHPYHFRGRDGYELSQNSLRKRGYDFRICYREEWEGCLKGIEGSWEVYLDSFFLFFPGTLSPCTMLGNNPCKAGIEIPGWAFSFEDAVKFLCLKDRAGFRSYGSAVYLRISDPKPQDLDRVTDLLCYRPSDL
jgi:hypothetical protein